MRAGGGRTRSWGSLRGHPKRKAGKPRNNSGRAGAADRAGSVRKGTDPRRPVPAKPEQAVKRPKSASATAVAVAYGTSAVNFTPRKKSRQRLETFVPLQRHLYGDERVFLPCPGSAK